MLSGAPIWWWRPLPRAVRRQIPFYRFLAY